MYNKKVNALRGRMAKGRDCLRMSSSHKCNSKAHSITYISI